MDAYDASEVIRGAQRPGRPARRTYRLPCHGHPDGTVRLGLPHPFADPVAAAWQLPGLVAELQLLAALYLSCASGMSGASASPWPGTLAALWPPGSKWRGS
jgi:hypothetical protein